MYKNTPWCEKYRPTDISNIVLNKENKIIFDNIIETNTFPNLLLFGPPGIGKTTTIINLINKYQKKNNVVNKSLIIHLNASDDRGIDIIRNNIYYFVKSDNLFTKGTKFVILDEVDYMTKSAQQALKYLIIENNSNIKFCLICNYISKIELSLQILFCKIKFNVLPYKSIYNFLDNINKNENLNFEKQHLDDIINYFNYDLRAMINFIQSNKFNRIETINFNIYEDIYQNNIKNNNYKHFSNLLDEIENTYSLKKNIIVIKYIDYIINNKLKELDKTKFEKFEFLIHHLNNEEYVKKYLYLLMAN
jgi:DNA polymerase III delta prime subunit